MALLFSKVTVLSGHNTAELLVSGQPKAFDDLEGWTVFDKFLSCLSAENEVSVHTETYLYGEGEVYKASLEEVAYLTKRVEADRGFLKNHTKNIANGNFTFDWSVKELFELNLNQKGSEENESFGSTDVGRFV